MQWLLSIVILLTATIPVFGQEKNDFFQQKKIPKIPHPAYPPLLEQLPLEQLPGLLPGLLPEALPGRPRHIAPETDLVEKKVVLPEYPLRCTMKTVPKVIHYGDLVFATITVTNDGDKTIIVPKSLQDDSAYHDFEGCTISLTENHSEVYVWHSARNMTIKITGIQYLTGRNWIPGHSLKPGKSIEIGFRPLWVPLPEFINRSKAQELKQLVDSECQLFQWKIHQSFDNFAAVGIGEPRYNRKGKLNFLPLEGIKLRRLPEHGYAIPDITMDCSQIKIQPRPDEELSLLNEWFLEFPETGNGYTWHISGLFAYSDYARSPMSVLEKYLPDRSTLEFCQRFELEGALLQVNLLFLEKMKTPTREAEHRICRSKSIEKILLMRAETSNSTISPMMKEFIIFRGHLVEIRYAKDKDTESKAFDVMLDWIETTRYDDLWKKYLDKIVLNKRSHPDVLSPESFDEYRARFLDEKGG